MTVEERTVINWAIAVARGYRQLERKPSEQARRMLDRRTELLTRAVERMKIAQEREQRRTILRGVRDED